MKTASYQNVLEQVKAVLRGKWYQWMLILERKKSLNQRSKPPLKKHSMGRAN